MSAEEGNKKLPEDKIKSAEEAKPEKSVSSILSYKLVVIMLSILGVLLIILLVMPYWDSGLLEYYKWTLSALLAAFGAWIGAGAAYFFGKENLQESSRSTETAMRIQQEFFRRPPVIERIKDMTLTAMNSKFFFEFGDTKDAVRQKLAEFKGYWFVPVVAKDTGILKDIIHAQVFWNTGFAQNDTKLNEMILEMDKDDILRKLHGEAFYIKISLNDKISDVNNLINQRDAEVAIVVDEKGKPSHCLSKTDLRTFLNVQK